MDARQQLLALAQAYSAHTGRSPARVATLAVNSGALFKRLDAGLDITLGTFEKCLAWFAANWPEGLDWPHDVPRPPPAPAGEPMVATA